MSNSHRSVCANWAAQTGKCQRGFNIWYEGEIIYSYGRHFAIARMIGDIVLATTERYSVSTERHKGICYMAAYREGKRIYHVPNVNARAIWEHRENHASFETRALENEAKAKRARKYGPSYLAAAERMREDAIDYSRDFNLGYIN